jgi:hypothetical protein
MKSRGFWFEGEIKDFGTGRYTMAMAPDQILLELFETVPGSAPENLRRVFDMDADGSLA